MKIVCFADRSWRDDDVIPLTGVLKKDNYSNVIDLSNNRIGNDGARAIFASLSKKTKIRELNLGYNNITDKSTQVIIDFLESNSSTFLRSICLSNNSMSRNCMARVEKALAALAPNSKAGVELEWHLLSQDEVGMIGEEDTQAAGGHSKQPV